ncbi:MAG: hypothetical protein V4576_00105 [Patescibacteria group bacterium]
MKIKDLAWKGTTTKQKRELLELSLAERDRLVADGKVRDGQLGLASTCVDIIGTANSVLKNEDASEREEWKKLLAEAREISTEAVATVENEDKDDWAPSEFEVVGAIYLKTADGDVEMLDHALELFNAGARKALSQGNKPMGVLLLGQVLRTMIAKGEIDEVKRMMYSFHTAIIEAGKLTPEVETRVYRALAEAVKFVSIQVAENAGLDNQALKGKAI